MHVLNTTPVCCSNVLISNFFHSVMVVRTGWLPGEVETRFSIFQSSRNMFIAFAGFRNPFTLSQALFGSVVVPQELCHARTL
jgi:hypothetical protein